MARSSTKTPLVKFREVLDGALPFCRRLEDALEQQDPLIIHLPRASGQGTAIRHLQRSLRSRRSAQSLIVSVGDYVREGDILYRELVRALGAELEERKFSDAPRDMFREALKSKASSSETGFTLILNVTGPDFAEPAFEVICDIHRVLSEMDGALTGGLNCLIIDDYSLYFYEQWRTQKNSRWDLFDREYYTSLSEVELKSLLSTIDQKLPSAFRIGTMTSERLYALTGGHYGLLIDVLSKYGTGSVP